VRKGQEEHRGGGERGRRRRRRRRCDVRVESVVVAITFTERQGDEDGREGLTFVYMVIKLDYYNTNVAPVA